MGELQHLTAWVKEQYPEGYLLTWLLTQPGLWWCDGEIYQAALLKDGDSLKQYIQKNEKNEMLRGISSKLKSDRDWQALATSLAQIFAIYQKELSQLQTQRLGQDLARQQGAVDSIAGTGGVQKPLPDPLTGNN
ncbi:hypothetical protein IQ235_15085 [Oscillatoriales cyanobacterium LEGE 11467]|uniref:Uncharacterized protein n=1 Tax=Zarconia navalis LEGE 11467 TaxID=1828826 RepID=A0A928VYS4_9CYAN|nr:hypothetical protein [Zarconia navalis]MBE9042104.1 hypothetical protein [Zarconia navalis LEGE 11467]